MIDHGKRNVLGVLVDAVDYEAAQERVLKAARERRPYGVSALAVHGVMTGVADDVHRYRLNALDLVTPDGQPVRWALNLLHGAKLKCPVAGPDLTLRLCASAAEDGLPIYFYGSTDEVLAALQTNLQQMFPGLLIAGAEPSRFRRLSTDELNTVALRIRDSGLVAGVVMATAALYALLSYQASSIALEFVDQSVTNRTGKFAVATALWDDLGASPEHGLFGLGPGESVSRFAFLTTPKLLKEGSPALLLGLSESQGADHYQAIATSGSYTGNSSFSAAQSSALGVIGDYGISGLIVFGGMILAVLNALRRAEDVQLRSSALAGWALLIPLAIVFDWLEQPPFTLAVMLITGLALRRFPDTGSRPPAVELLDTLVMNAPAPKGRSSSRSATDGTEIR